MESQSRQTPTIGAEREPFQRGGDRCRAGAGREKMKVADGVAEAVQLNAAIKNVFEGTEAQ